MSYRYDKQKKVRQRWYGIGILFFMLALFTPLFGWIFDVFERPLERAWNNSNQTMNGGKNLFQSWYAKTKLIEENQALQERITALEIDNIRTDYLAQQLEDIQELEEQGVENTAHILGTIGSDRLVIDGGTKQGIDVGDLVIAYDRVLLGEVTEVFDTTSRVELFSHTDRSLDGWVSSQEQLLVVTGYGGSRFVIEAPRELELEEGDVVYSQKYPDYMIGSVGHVEFDPRDPFKKIYLALPVNLKNTQIIGIKKEAITTQDES